MDKKLVGILGIIFVSIILLRAVFGIEVVVGHFQTVRRHGKRRPEVRKCATSILQENEYVGARISQQEGTCQGLQHSWGENETKESGYDYAKKVSLKKSFNPPLEANKEHWKIPGVLKAGAKQELVLSRSTEARWRIVNSDVMLVDKCSYPPNGRQEIYLAALLDLKNSSIVSDSKKTLKMTFHAQPDSDRVLVNDKEVFTMKRELQLHKMRQIYVNRINANPAPSPADPIFIKSLQFAEKEEGK